MVLSVWAERVGEGEMCLCLCVCVCVCVCAFAFAFAFAFACVRACPCVRELRGGAGYVV